MAREYTPLPFPNSDEGMKMTVLLDSKKLRKLRKTGMTTMMMGPSLLAINTLTLPLSALLGSHFKRPLSSLRVKVNQRPATMIHPFGLSSSSPYFSSAASSAQRILFLMQCLL